MSPPLTASNITTHSLEQYHVTTTANPYGEQHHGKPIWQTHMASRTMANPTASNITANPYGEPHHYSLTASNITTHSLEQYYVNTTHRKQHHGKLMLRATSLLTHRKQHHGKLMLRATSLLTHRKQHHYSLSGTISLPTHREPHHGKPIWQTHMASNITTHSPQATPRQPHVDSNITTHSPQTIWRAASLITLWNNVTTHSPQATPRQTHMASNITANPYGEQHHRKPNRKQHHGKPML